MPGWHIFERLTPDSHTILSHLGGQGAHDILSSFIVGIHTWKGLHHTLKELGGPASHYNSPWLAQMCPWLNWHQWHLILSTLEVIHLTRFQFYIHLFMNTHILRQDSLASVLKQLMNIVENWKFNNLCFGVSQDVGTASVALLVLLTDHCF